MGAPSSDKAGIRQTIRALRAAGYGLLSVDDGGDENVNVSNEDEAIDAVMAVDDAWLIVTTPGGMGTPAVRFVMGNEPYEVICDYSVSLSHVIDPLCDSWDE